MLIKVKEHRNKMEEEYEKLYKRLVSNKETSKDLEKEIKNGLVIEKSLRNTLENLKQEGDNLATEMKARENVLRETS